MSDPHWFRAFGLLTCIAGLAIGAAHAATSIDAPPDAPHGDYAPAADPRPIPPTYDQALASWTTPEDIAHFAGAKFAYDRARALALAEPAAASGARPSIREPRDTFAHPSGVCLDLARFGVETLNRLDDTWHARFLMLEFEPVVIEGRTLRRHWIASFRRDGALWFFADSARPGHVAGPYASIEAFIAEYAAFRSRPIVAWREADTYARRARAAAKRPSAQ